MINLPFLGFVGCQLRGGRREIRDNSWDAFSGMQGREDGGLEGGQRREDKQTDTGHIEIGITDGWNYSLVRERDLEE